MLYTLMAVAHLRDKTSLSCGPRLCCNRSVHLLSLAGSIGVVIFSILQAALIIGLLVNRGKRLQGEAAGTELAGQVTLLRQLALALTHELSQPLGAILLNAEAADIMLQASAPDLEELRAIVKDILSDDARAGQVIDQLRSLLKQQSVNAQPIDLPGVNIK